MLRCAVGWRFSVSDAVSSRAVTALVIGGGLTAAGLVLRPVMAPVWAAMAAGEPALRLDPGVAASEQAVVSGLLGGFRAAVADIVWLEMAAAAEEHDLAATESLLHLVTLIDPRPLYFWVNGARIMAYDMPAWQMEPAGGDVRVSGAVGEGIGPGQARRALRLLAAARRFHPASAALWIEQANIELNRLRDTAAAAESYRRAWEQPGAPYYAARLHAELLRRLGRKAEALAWLVKLHPQLPAGDEAAGADLVLARIRELERELGVPAGQGYGRRTGPGAGPS